MNLKVIIGFIFHMNEIKIGDLIVSKSKPNTEIYYVLNIVPSWNSPSAIMAELFNPCKNIKLPNVFLTFAYSNKWTIISCDDSY